MTFATPTSVAGYLSQKKTPCHKVNHHFDESGRCLRYFPCPTIEGMRSCDATRQSPFFICSCFFFHVSRELHTSNASRFFLAKIDLTRSDWIWLTIDSQEILLIQRLLFSWQSWYAVVHFGSLVHYEFTWSTYGIYRDPSDTKHDVSQTVKQKSVLMNTPEILTNKDTQYPKTFEPISYSGWNNTMKAWTNCPTSRRFGWHVFLTRQLLLLPFALQWSTWPGRKASRLQLDDTFAPANRNGGWLKMRWKKKPNTKRRDVGFRFRWLQRFSRHDQMHD